MNVEHLGKYRHERLCCYAFILCGIGFSRIGEPHRPVTLDDFNKALAGAKLPLVGPALYAEIHLRARVFFTDSRKYFEARETRKTA